MKVSELIEMLKEVENQEWLVCIPDFSLCNCGARDGECSAQAITIKRNEPLAPRVVIE